MIPILLEHHDIVLPALIIETKTLYCNTYLSNCIIDILRHAIRTTPYLCHTNLMKLKFYVSTCVHALMHAILKMNHMDISTQTRC